MYTEAPAIRQLTDEINEWVENTIPPDYPKHFPPNDAHKIIRESVSGYQVLKPQEYLVLDCPVVQRLRYIHQTGLSYLVYPTALHTRFDHSLGVARIAENIGRFLGEEKSSIEELRLAALLHDVGHSFFSHLSENIMGTRFEETFAGAKEIELFHDKNAAEILSYLIVASPRFQKLMNDIFNHYDCKASIERISLCVIGKPRESSQFAYMGDIISGPFDADKLDYLVRDCNFTGIRADVDVDRVTISSSKMIPDYFKGFEKRSGREAKTFSNRNLIMKSSGASNLEQIVLNKILLFPAIYHHHKVRSIECMVKAIFEVIWADPDNKERDARLRFNRPVDFLGLSEFDFLSLGMQDKQLAPLIKKLLDRDLLKRCLVLTSRYVERDPDLRLHDLFKLTDEYPKRPRQEQIHLLRQYIWDLIPERFRTSIHDLWVDIPEPPNIDQDVDSCWIDIGTKWLVPLRDFLPYGEWLDTYESNKLKGHVFYVPDCDCRNEVNKAAITVFRDALSVEFGPRATIECKIE